MYDIDGSLRDKLGSPILDAHCLFVVCFVSVLTRFSLYLQQQRMNLSSQNHLKQVN